VPVALFIINYLCFRELCVKAILTFKSINNVLTRGMILKPELGLYLPSFPALTKLFLTFHPVFILVIPMLISEYPHIKEVIKGTEIELDTFLTKIQIGTYQDLILPLRAEKDPEKRKKLKNQLPYATISGVFSTRNNDGLRQHSGFLAIDVDDCDPEEIKQKIRKNQYVYAAFTSCSGTGLCIIFRIHPLKHLISFEGIAEYLYKHYGIVVDQNCKDISRPRFVSFDPGIILNDKASEFKEFPKAKPGRKADNKPQREVVYVQSDFQDIILQIEQNGTDITGDYRQWLRIGFALADKFGESGREYFHTVSRQGNTYTEAGCDRQYDACLNATNTGVTIATFYWICKEHNIAIVSDRIRDISKTAYSYKKAGGNQNQAIDAIRDADRDLVADIVSQVYSKNVRIENASDIETGRIWMINRGLRRNSITDQLHLDGPALTDSEKKAVELQMREALPDVDYSDIAMLLRSSNVPVFNEIFSYFNDHIATRGTGAIKRLAACLNSPTGAGTDYVERMLTKWLVGGIACLYKDESHTMLILCGEHHGDGKSYFFKNLLPPELSHLCACKDLSDISGKSSERKDFEIAITKSWLIFDDEMAGKTKRDHKAIRAMLAKSYSDVRGSYKEVEEHRKRIAFFGGTSNDFEVISDYGHNRRIIPMQILHHGIDQEAKDAIKPVEYIMEAYHLYHSGYEYRILDKEIEFLNEHTAMFQEQTSELDMVRTRFTPVSEGCAGEYLTATEIKIYLESDNKVSVSISKLKDAFGAIGVSQELKSVNGVYARYYYVCKKQLPLWKPPVVEAKKQEDLPF
jgi:predicted P-loop ATPase